MNKDLEILDSSPIYAMSLGSHELFHSNIWAWMMRKYPFSIHKVFGIESIESPKIERELKNRDITIKFKDDIWIIENKFKSIPYAEQLQKYKDNCLKKEKFCGGILTCISKPEFEVEGWSVLTYEEILSNIEKLLPEIPDDKDCTVLKDYILVTKKTVELIKNELESVDSIKLSGDDFKKLEAYRISDILRKLIAQQFVNKYKRKIIEEIDIDEKLIYIDTDYTNKNAIINAFILYIADVAYQKYVLENCGVNVTGTYLVCLNKDYIFDGTLDIDKLFVISDVSDEIKPEEVNIKANLSIAERLLTSDKEPEIDIHENCKNPYLCGFWKYCTKHIPEPSVFNLYRMPFKKKIDHYRHGRIKYDDLMFSGEVTNPKQLRQMLHYLSEQGDYIDKDGVRDFLDTLSYPIYFLDFETMQPVIPEYVGTHPYAQIPFQYSLHYIEYEGGPLLHKEFLAESGTDPRRAIAEQLCEDIPMNVCVTAYRAVVRKYASPLL